jgi:hypothetical protein
MADDINTENFTDARSHLKSLKITLLIFTGEIKNNEYRIASIVVKWLAVLLHIQEVLCSNHGPETSSHDQNLHHFP